MTVTGCRGLPGLSVTERVGVGHRPESGSPWVPYMVVSLVQGIPRSGKSVTTSHVQVSEIICCLLGNGPLFRKFAQNPC